MQKKKQFLLPSPAKVFQHNAWNTFVSCVMMVFVLGFVFFVSYPLDAVFSWLMDMPSYGGSFLLCAVLVRITLVVGFFIFMFRLSQPLMYKYTLRYNLFATLNCGFGITGLILGSGNRQGSDGFMLTAVFMGGVYLFDIYLIKLKYPSAAKTNQ